MTKQLHYLLTCLALLVLSASVNGQTTVAIGTGTSSSTTYGPYYRASASSTVNGSSKAMMYTAAELATAGIISGTVIHSLKWSKSTAFVLSNGATATAVLYMKDGGSATAYSGTTNVQGYLAAGFVPVDTVNYDVAVNNIPASGWVGFDVNWTYGGGTLELFVDWVLTPGSGNPTTGSFSWNYSSTSPDNKHMYLNSVASSSSNFTNTANRPNIQIVFTPPPACSGTPNPGTITAPVAVCAGAPVQLSVTGQSVGTGISYQWESSPAGAGTWSNIANATNLGYTTPAVSSAIDYRVLVTCASAGPGVYTPVVTIETGVAPTYTYTFAGFPSECWVEKDGILNSNSVLTGTTSTWATETWLSQATGSAVIHNNYATATDNSWLLSPTIRLGAGGNYQLDFDLAFVQDGAATPAALGSDDTFAVVISTDNGVTWDIANVLSLYTAANSLLPAGYQHVTIPLSAYSGNVMIGFYASEGTVDDPADTDVMIDNFTVQLTPSCTQPYFPAAGYTGGYNANLSWSQTGSPAQWQIEYGPTGFTQGTGTLAMAASNPYNLTGLTPLTGYDFYVRAVCGPNDTSAWSTVSSFTTGCPYATIPYLEDFTNYPPTCWIEADGQLAGSSVLTPGTSVWAGDDWMNNAALGRAAKILLSVATDRDWLVSPSINLGTGSYQLEFDLAMVNSVSPYLPSSIGSDDSVLVVISTDDGQTWSYSNVLYTWTAANSLLPGGSMHVVLPLTSYTGVVKIGFYGSEGTVNDLESVDVMIDNFAIVAQPSCPQPTFLAATAASGSSVNLSWTQTGAGNQWQIEYGASGFTQGTGTVVNTGTNPHLLSGLNPGSSYSFYVRTICGANDTSLWSGPATFTLPPANDDAVNATLLTVGMGCNGTTSNGSLAGATVQAGEPTVTCQGAAGNFRSVWYKFAAPASGQVRISNDYTVSVPDSLVDSKMAVYQVTDSSDFTSYQILACDDDNGVVASGYRNIIYVTNLTPGAIYYIKLDKWNASEIDGSFCIDVSDFTPAMISSDTNCLSTAFGNNDWFTGGTAWVSLVDDAGLVIANLRTNASSSIGSAFSKAYLNTGAVRVFGTQAYMDRNYELTVDTQPSSPVDIQFFFTDADYNALAAADPNVSMSSLGATRLPTQPCMAIYDTVGQVPQFLAQTANGSSQGVRYIVVPTPGFSSFFLHAGNGPLQIDLTSIKAENQGASNRLSWMTAAEARGDRFIVERSADGTVFADLGIVDARGTASAYTYFDQQPYTGMNYYRLRMTTPSGAFKYSGVVSAYVKNGSGFSLQAFPNPAADQLTVTSFGTAGEDATVTITNIAGKLVRQVPMPQGSVTIGLSGLAKGVYLVRYTDSQRTESIRITKL